nr:hypothetical protein Itr_chr12CG14780 [Ipomoea trifida]
MLNDRWNSWPPEFWSLSTLLADEFQRDRGGELLMLERGRAPRIVMVGTGKRSTLPENPNRCAFGSLEVGKKMWSDGSTALLYHKHVIDNRFQLQVWVRKIQDHQGVYARREEIFDRDEYGKNIAILP